REELAKLTGDVGALRSRSEAAADEIARATEALGQARERAEAAKDALAEAEADVETAGSGDADIDSRLQALKAEFDNAKARVGELASAERDAHTEATQWKAREEALSLGLNRKDGAGALLGQTEHIPG